MPLANPTPTLTAKQEARFWSKVAAGPNGCILWTASTARGYGITKFNGRNYLAHRIAYSLALGPIPIDLQIDHLCLTRNCINYRHHELVTQAENIRRSGIANNQRNGKTHCPRRHPYDEANTRWYRGMRYCRACQASRRKAA